MAGMLDDYLLDPVAAGAFPDSVAGMLSVPRKKRSQMPYAGEGVVPYSPDVPTAWPAPAAPDGYTAPHTPIPATDVMAKVTQPDAAPAPASGGGWDEAGFLQPGAAPQNTAPPGQPMNIVPPGASNAMAQAQQQPGFLDKVSGVLARNPLTLMAMGAGMMGAPSFATGMSRGLAAAVPASQADMKQNIQMQGIRESYKALIAMGYSPQEALAAVYQPEMMKQLVSRMYPTFGDVGTNAWGQPQKGFIDMRRQTYTMPTSAPPQNVANQPITFQLQVAPEGSQAVANGRRITKRGGRWVDVETGQPYSPQ